MSLLDNIFWNWTKPKPKTIIPYKPGYDPTSHVVVPPDDINKKDIQNMWLNLKPINLAKIQVHPFSTHKYFHEIYDKTQIVLHHTVSGEGVDGDINSWEQASANIAVCILVDRAGTPWQLFSSKYWAYHLAAGNHDLDRHSIAIEIDNWGWLIPGDGTYKTFNNPPRKIKTELGRYYTYYGNPVAVPLQYYSEGFRGYNYYEKYTDNQIQTVGELLLYWNMMYNIPLTYNPTMWDVTREALGGKPGVWTHCSYRPANEKTDAHPQPELIDMLSILDTIK